MNSEACYFTTLLSMLCIICASQPATSLTSPDPVRCPMEPSNLPPWGYPSCQCGENWCRIHVGGQRTDFNSGTDFMCLSSEPVPKAAIFGTARCRARSTFSECAEMLSKAGCDYKIDTPFTQGCCDCASVPQGRCSAHLHLVTEERGFLQRYTNIQACINQCREVCCNLIWYKDDGTCQLQDQDMTVTPPGTEWKVYRRNDC